MPDKPKQPPNEKPVSLYPLTTKEALRRAMQAPPKHEAKPKKQTPKTP